MAVQILFRRGLAGDWTSLNPILASGEPGYETDTGEFKIGDGTTVWNGLPYADSGGAGASVNTTYTVSAETTAGGASVRLSGSDASVDNVNIIAGANVTVTRTDASNITIASAAGGGASAVNDLTDVTITSPTNGQVLKYNGSAWVNGTDLNDGLGSVAINDVTDVVITSPSLGQVLKYDGANWINDTDATGGAGVSVIGDIPNVDETGAIAGSVLKYNGANWVVGTDDTGGSSTVENLTNVTINTPTNGQVLKYNGAEWVNAADDVGGGALPTRGTVAGSTGVIADTVSATVDITGFSTYGLMKIETSAAAWVTLYTDAAARTADSSRLQGEDPLPGAGVIAEVITTGAETILVSPATIGFNNETVPTTNIPARVTNLSGGSADITVTLTVIQMES